MMVLLGILFVLSFIGFHVFLYLLFIQLYVRGRYLFSGLMQIDLNDLYFF